ncbi:MMPL family transporter [Streptomyces sp. NPDC048436]|uniref:MMPL family transporter n=1 Tax=Streptomyces sp. NPDC048436 TaxID=3365550 RepID=UPI003718755C
MFTQSRRRALTVLLCAVVLFLLAGWQVAPALGSLGAGGTLATGTEAEEAERRAAELGLPTPDLIIALTAPAGTAASRLRDGERNVAAVLADDAAVSVVASPSTSGERWLRSRDSRTLLVTADLRGDEKQRVETAQRLVPAARSAASPLGFRAGGAAWVTAQIAQQCEKDLLRAELLAAPAVLLVLLIAYGSLVCALLPLLVAGFTVTCTIPVLGVLARATNVSVFAVNAAAAIGFGLAVDYTLFLISRYQEEEARGVTKCQALHTTWRTCGRSVAFSAGAVVSCLAITLLVPSSLLRSLALAGITVTVLSAAASLLLLPSLLTLLGTHLNRADPLRRLRRTTLGEPSRFWQKTTRRVIRRPVLTAVAATALLGMLALPFTRVQLGVEDHRALPLTASTTTAQLDGDFAHPPSHLLPVITDLSATRGNRHVALDRYIKEIASLPEVAAVRVLPGPPAGQNPSSRLLIVAGEHAPTTPEAAQLVRALRQVPGTLLVGGRAAQITDTTAAVTHALPRVAWLLAAAFVLLLALLTRSLVAPIKAILVAAVSLGASLGILVLVFQDGHGRALLGNFSATGDLDVSLLLFTMAIALSLSVDYEVFLLGRIKEEFDHTGDNSEALVLGIARTGRLVTSASGAVAMSTAALATSQVSSLKLIGVGIAVAALTDAVVVRGVLVPAVMAALGPANWWRPGRSIRFRDAPHRGESPIVETASQDPP